MASSMGLSSIQPVHDSSRSRVYSSSGSSSGISSTMTGTGHPSSPVSTSSSSSSSTPSNHSSLPANVNELLWEEKRRTVRELISNYRLPLAVKLKHGDISKYLPSPATSTSDFNEDTLSQTSSHSSNDVLREPPSPFKTRSSSISRSTGKDLNQNSLRLPDGRARDEDTVLQIHETRRRKIILARKMTWEKRQNDYVVTGEQVEIPASFKGWLEVVPDDGRPVEYFDTIGSLTSVKPRRFLVRTSTVGYQLSADETGASCWMPTEMKPGEVLTTGIIYMDNKKTKNATQRNIFKRLLKQSKVKKEQELKYLQCFSADGNEIMIPLIMSGVFSPVGDASMANYDAVYELQDLIMAFGLPVNAQLIHINPKETFHCPRGVLRLYGTREEELVISSRVGSDGALFSKTSGSERFEIPIEVDALFCRGVVKKKPAIKAKLVDVFNSSVDKDKLVPTHTEKEKEHKDKNYVRATSVDEFKLRAHQDRRLSSPPSMKSTPLMANYSSNNTVPESDLGNSKRKRTSVDISSYKSSLDSKTYSSNPESPSYKPSLESSTYKSNLDPTGVYKSSLENPSNKSVKEVSVASNETYSPYPSSKQSKTTTASSSPMVNRKMSDQGQAPTEVELPERAKEMKKSRSTGILDKLSVRKVRKERAKLKELKSDDVFSKRIVRSEISYQDFFGGLDDEEESKKDNKTSSSKEQDSSHNTNGSSTPADTYNKGDADKTKTASSSKKGSDYSTLVQRRQSIQNRDLPPIPPDSPHRSESKSSQSLDSISSHHNHNTSKESLYEHLPPAPQPPINTTDKSTFSHYDHEDEEDGYMVPMQLQQQRQQRLNENADVVTLRRNTTSTPNDSLRYARARKARSELPMDFVQQGVVHDDGCPLDIDHLFSFAYNNNASDDRGDRGGGGGLGNHHTLSTSQLYGMSDRVPAWRSDLPPSSMAELEQRFMDNLDLETRGHHHPQVNTRQSRSRQATHAMSANPNATIRSHNLRKMRPNVMEVFHFTDSFRDVRHADQHQNGPMHTDNFVHSAYEQTFFSRPPLLNSRSMDASMMSPILQQQQQQQQSIYGPGVAFHYSESEPALRSSHRSNSLGAYNENFLKQGDDSAISMCSRGDGGFPNESEYSYGEYSDQGIRLEDGWTPPDEIEGMSVQDVSKSLRYIGMKDRVVLRFSNEQIDGSMLATLDKKLLKEGFPELNALELKKILDFVQGWRPKKR